MSSDLLFDDQLGQRTTGFECSFASGFDVSANSAMGKLCTGRRGSVAKTCSAVPGSRHPSVVADRAGLMATKTSSRIAQTECTHLPELLVHCANQWASMDVRDKKRRRCGAIMNYVHSAASIAHKEAKARMRGKKTGGVWTRERIGLVCNRPIQYNDRIRKHEPSTGLVW